MATTLPTNYDWNSTQAPSGPFGVEPISGSESVLKNLTGVGALGTKGILSFLDGAAGGIDLTNLSRFAGGLGNLFGGFDMKKSIKELDKRAEQTESKIDDRIANIYPGLTGMTGEEALNKYYDNFAKTVANVQAQGRSDLSLDPNLSTQYNRLNTRVQDIQNQYSLAGRIGGYEKLALDPAVVSMDVSGIRKAADWTAPEIASQYGMFTDYSGPQASKFIYGGSNTADAIGRYYNTSGDVAGLMNYGTLA